MSIISICLKGQRLRKIAEQFNKISGRFLKRERGAFERMGLKSIGTLSSQTEILNRDFPNFFVNGKHPMTQLRKPSLNEQVASYNMQPWAADKMSRISVLNHYFVLCRQYEYS